MGTMHSPLPASIQPLVDAYLKAIEPLNPHFYGIYIYGSIALGAFEEQASDIDVVALTLGEWSPAELKQLAELHVGLIKAYPISRRLEVFYIPMRYLGALHPEWQRDEKAAYPVMHDGQFSLAGRGELNAVTWWLIQHKGIRLLGPEPYALPLEVTWQDVLATMRFNLDVYFARKAKRPYVYLDDSGVEFAVTNLCRILTTIEDGEIVSKSAALERWRDRLPERWRPLLDEAWRIRHHLKNELVGADLSCSPPIHRPICAGNEGIRADESAVSTINRLLRRLPGSRLQRMRETLAFIRYVRGRGRKMLSL